MLNLIQEGKYIFIYGGFDEEWRNQFAKRVEALAKDHVIQDAKISIVMSCVEMGYKGKDDRLQKFLSPGLTRTLRVDGLCCPKGLN